MSDYDNLAADTKFVARIIDEERDFTPSEMLEIKRSRNRCYIYAELVLDGRFIDGELMISTSARLSYWYARHIIKGQFELGEAAISTSEEDRLLYKKHLKSLGISV